jgi:PqqD family protein of HPr-rel-A system
VTLRFRADVSVTDTEYGTVLLDERSGRYWQLNPSGALVVRTLLGGAADEEAAIAALTSEYAVDRARAEQDVAALLGGLREAGLVTP